MWGVASRTQVGKLIARIFLPFEWITVNEKRLHQLCSNPDQGVMMVGAIEMNDTSLSV